jgi:large subunit ribosomal protein L34
MSKKRTFQPSKRKRRNKHGLWTEWLLMEEKFLRVEELGRHKLTVSSEPRHKK